MSRINSSVPLFRNSPAGNATDQSKVGLVILSPALGTFRETGKGYCNDIGAAFSVPCVSKSRARRPVF
jgi:hypothetical protein